MKEFLEGKVGRRRASWLLGALLASAAIHAGDAGTGAPPKILDLAATPPSVESGDAGALITFRLEDPDSTLVSWSISLSSAADSHDQPGQMSKAYGTEAVGVPVKTVYNAPQTWKPLTVVLTVTAMDEQGNTAQPQMLTIPVAPGGMNRKG